MYSPSTSGVVGTIVGVRVGGREVGVGVGGTGVTVGRGVLVGTGVRLGVGGTGVTIGRGVLVGTRVGLGVAVSIGVAVGRGVAVGGTRVGVSVGIAIGVAAGRQATMTATNVTQTIADKVDLFNCSMLLGEQARLSHRALIVILLDLLPSFDRRSDVLHQLGVDLRVGHPEGFYHTPHGLHLPLQGGDALAIGQ